MVVLPGDGGRRGSDLRPGPPVLQILGTVLDNRLAYARPEETTPENPQAKATWIKEYDITLFKKRFLNHEEKAIVREIEAHERKIAAYLKKVNEQLAKEQSMALAEERKLEEKQVAGLKRYESRGERERGNPCLMKEYKPPQHPSTKWTASSWPSALAAALSRGPTRTASSSPRLAKSTTSTRAPNSTRAWSTALPRAPSSRSRSTPRPTRWSRTAPRSAASSSTSSTTPTSQSQPSSRSARTPQDGATPSAPGQGTRPRARRD
ncbi:hypothetical protein B0T24DRAFT_229088 [Lasiosphaeria ovina]|uniref:Uncharacterized protein n=1 Tax=Lasiosphaeria ovina TaxID=92902 RepID=A0AAE0KI96_9PEZI|nr:hypothetical protein B0T24DRAFT_229088 [Lasiosphaeria ovina]